jgi:hypothetical protein
VVACSGAVALKQNYHAVSKSRFAYDLLIRRTASHSETGRSSDYYCFGVNVTLRPRIVAVV